MLLTTIDNSMTNLLNTLLKDNHKNVETISFNILRKWVGILGIILPLVMIVGSIIFSDCQIILPSISHYYYSNMNVFFVGILCAVAFFLITYSGYSRLDNILTSIAAWLCLIVVTFPTDNNIGYTCLKNGNQFLKESHSNLHFACAGLFFFILAVMSIWIFTRTNKKGEMSPEKKKRNKIYIVCGIIMILSILILITHKTFFEHKSSHSTFTFWFETLMLVAFGISWLTKAEVIYGDNKGKILSFQ